MNSHPFPFLLLGAALVLGGCTTTVRVPSLAVQSGPPAQSGQVVWHDLITPKPEASMEFYRGLFGWSFEQIASPYAVIRDGDDVVGGLIDARKTGKRPDSGLWLMSVGVQNLEELLVEVEASGGTVIRGTYSLPDRGMTAIIEDPQGAILQVVELAENAAASPAPNVWIWHELLTDDLEASANWYAKQFPVQANAISDDRFQLLLGEKGSATISRNPFIDTRNTWIPVIRVSEMQPLLDKVAALKGRALVTDSMKDKGLALLLDPAGAPILLQELEVQP